MCGFIEEKYQWVKYVFMDQEDVKTKGLTTTLNLREFFPVLISTANWIERDGT